MAWPYSLYSSVDTMERHDDSHRIRIQQGDARHQARVPSVPGSLLRSRMREQIVCPACGVLYTPVALAGGRCQARRGRLRENGLAAELQEAGPVLPEPDPQIAAAPRREVEVEAAGEEVPLPLTPLRRTISSSSRSPMTADVSGLVDVDIEEPKER